MDFVLTFGSVSLRACRGFASFVCGTRDSRQRDFPCRTRPASLSRRKSPCRPVYGMRVATGESREVRNASAEWIVKKCRILFVSPAGNEIAVLKDLEAAGFVVRQTHEWPDDDLIPHFEIMVVVTSRMENLPMLAARIRAKRGFGRRVLIALAPAGMSDKDRRAAVGTGFDDILPKSVEVRTLMARILRRLRLRPEHRCVLPRKRRAA